MASNPSFNQAGLEAYYLLQDINDFGYNYHEVPAEKQEVLMSLLLLVRGQIRDSDIRIAFTFLLVSKKDLFAKGYLLFTKLTH